MAVQNYMMSDRLLILEEQLLKFQKNVASCEDGFDSNKSVKMLQILVGTQQSTVYRSVDSIETLRKIVRALDEEPVKESAADDLLTEYFKWYLDFFVYLRTLKYSFDHRIHCALMKYLYNDEELAYHDSNLIISDCPQNKIDGHASRLDAVSATVKTVCDKYNQQKSGRISQHINQVSVELARVSQRVESLIREDLKLDARQGDNISLLMEETERVTHNLPRTGRYFFHTGSDVAAFVRLIPSIISLLAKMGSLARQWWNLGQERTTYLTEDFTVLKSINREIMARLNEIRDDIPVIEEKLSIEETDLETLVRIEGRSNVLNAKLLKLDRNIDTSTEHLKTLKNERTQLFIQLGNDSENDFEVISKLRRNRTAHQRTENDLKLLYYQSNLLASDFELECEIKPTIVRHTEFVRERYEEKRNRVKSLQLEERDLQHSLPFIRQRRQQIETELLQQTMLRSKRDSVVNNAFTASAPLLH